MDMDQNTTESHPAQPGTSRDTEMTETVRTPGTTTPGSPSTSTLQQLLQLKEQAQALVTQITHSIDNIHDLNTAVIADLERTARPFFRSTTSTLPLSCREVVALSRQLLERLRETEQELRAHQRQFQLVAGTTIRRHQSRSVRNGLRAFQARVRELELEVERLKQSGRVLDATIAERIADERRAGPSVDS